MPHTALPYRIPLVKASRECVIWNQHQWSQRAWEWTSQSQKNGSQLPYGITTLKKYESGNPKPEGFKCDLKGYQFVDLSSDQVRSVSHLWHEVELSMSPLWFSPMASVCRARRYLGPFFLQCQWFRGSCPRSLGNLWRQGCHPSAMESSRNFHKVQVEYKSQVGQCV